MGGGQILTIPVILLLFLCMTYDPNDFQDQAAMLAALQRQRQLDLLSQKKVIPKNRACPWCGGELPGVVKKCMHCASDVSWFEGQPCTPENLEQLKKKSQRREEYLSEITKCQDCKCESVRRKLTDGRCLKCAKKFSAEQQEVARKSTEFGCLIAFSLLVIPLIYFGWNIIAKGFGNLFESGVVLSVFFLIFLVMISLIVWEKCDSILCGILSLIIALIVICLIIGGAR
jgi:hypothetical protein